MMRKIAIVGTVIAALCGPALAQSDEDRVVQKEQPDAMPEITRRGMLFLQFQVYLQAEDCMQRGLVGQPTLDAVATKVREISAGIDQKTSDTLWNSAVINTQAMNDAQCQILRNEYGAEAPLRPNPF